MRVLVTDGGPHPPEKWALVTVDDIMNLIQIDPGGPANAFIEKEELRLRLLKLLVSLHDHTQQEERLALKLKGDAHLDTPLDALAMARDAAGQIRDAAKGTMFFDHFARPEVQDVLVGIVGQHMTDIMHIERRWHVAGSA